MRVVDKYSPRSYSAIANSGGICLCDSEEGAFLVLRFPEDVERLKKLLDSIDITKVTNGETGIEAL